jgi:hypothetical protein
MGEQVVLGATIQCSMAVPPKPVPLNPTPGTVTVGGMTAATITDAVPMDNIPTFGMCNAPANPTVIAATAAPPPGVHKPGACTPVTEAWAPGSPTVMICGIPALTSADKCACNWGGVISVIDPGQVTTSVAG